MSTSIVESPCALDSMARFAAVLVAPAPLHPVTTITFLKSLEQEKFSVLAVHNYQL